MNVGCAMIVVTWEQCLKLDDSVAICLLNSSQEVGVEIGFVLGVAVAVAHHPGVYALLVMSLDSEGQQNTNAYRRIAVPDIHV